MAKLRTILLTTSILGAGAAVGAGVVIWGGLYNVASTEQHLQWTFSVLELAMRQSVRMRSRDIETPPLDDDDLVVRGAACFRDKCVQCHGAPGVAQGDIGKSMQPLPGPLVDARHRWRPRELYWVTRHGIKMSGMPAWEYRLSEQDLWSLVAFMNRLPELTPQRYAEMTSPAPGHGADRPAPVGVAAYRSGQEGTAPRDAAPACGPGPRVHAPEAGAGILNRAPGAATLWASDPAADRASGTNDAPDRPGDVAMGRRALYQYACNACHRIPGITGSMPDVGPPLDGMARRAMIGGRLANTPENMVRWLRHTREVDPLTAMPEMGVTPGDARDIAAYLATLD
ncbi:MAG: c-type cytochrome [Comamonadaceae bacterium]|nr:MAG: c-type cytochrome [Comamonadaceae bacterium]